MIQVNGSDTVTLGDDPSSVDVAQIIVDWGNFFLIPDRAASVEDLLGTTVPYFVYSDAIAWHVMGRDGSNRSS